MDLYQAKDDYLTALKKYDSRVLVNYHGKILRPYYFLKTEIEGQQYAIPFPSPKANVRFNPFTQIYINGKDQKQGRLFLLNMIPFESQAFHKIEFKKIANDIGFKYATLLDEQKDALLKQQNIIQRKALNIYKARYNKNHYKYEMLQKNACDFKGLLKYQNNTFKETIRKTKIIYFQNKK